MKRVAPLLAEAARTGDGVALLREAAVRWGNHVTLSVFLGKVFAYCVRTGGGGGGDGWDGGVAGPARASVTAGRRPW